MWKCRYAHASASKQTPFSHFKDIEELKTRAAMHATI
jgi:hypothetical protein